MTPIFPAKLAKLVGPFSPAVRSGDFIFASGQIGQSPTTGQLAGSSIEGQTEQVMQNISVILEAAGLSFDDVVRANVYLTDMGDFSAMNGVYGRYVKEPYPARTTIAVAALPLGARVEIDVVVQA